MNIKKDINNESNLVWNATSTALDYINKDNKSFDDESKQIKWYEKISIESVTELFKKCYFRKDLFIDNNFTSEIEKTLLDYLTVCR